MSQIAGDPQTDSHQADRQPTSARQSGLQPDQPPEQPSDQPGEPLPGQIRERSEAPSENSQAGPASEHHSAPAGLISELAFSELGLSAQPFEATVVGGEWYSDETTQEQLVDIKEALINGDDMLLLTGAIGAGKSVLLKQLSSSSGTRIQCFSVLGSERFSTFNLFSGLVEAFRLKPPSELQDVLDMVIPCLRALADRNTLGVIVLDDADQVSDKELSMLLGSVQYLNRGEELLLKVLLATVPEFETRIPELLPGPTDLTYAAISVEPFDIGRAAAYISHRLNKAGDFSEFPFSDKQMNAISMAANGLPAALNFAAAEQINQVYHPEGYQQGAEQRAERHATVAPAFLQNRAAKYALGTLGVAMILASLYLFIQPPPSTGDDGEYQVVSKTAIKPVTGEPQQQAAEPGRIALVKEPTTDILTEGQVVDSSGVDAAGDISELTTAAPQTPAANTNQADLATTIADIAKATGTEAAGSITTATAADSSARPATATSTATTASPDTANPDTANPDSNQAANNNSAQNTPAAAVSTQPAEKPASAAETQATAQTQAATGENEAVNQPPSQLESANWVLVQDPEMYTVQMSASRQRDSVVEFLVRSQLDGPNSIFSFKRGERTWYALVHGLYPTITAARNAIEAMPAAAKTNQPWIRAISQIQNAVKNQ